MTKIHCSIPTLFGEGVMRLTAARMQLDRLRNKAPREFNRRVKEFTTEREAIKIEPIPLMKFEQGGDLTIRRMSREEFEAEYG